MIITVMFGTLNYKERQGKAWRLFISVLMI